jgi:hypothetical protein
VPELQRLPPGETTHVFTATPAHLGYERYDVATQTATSHHFWTVDGRLTTFSSPHRYVWPSELDLMARLAGLALHGRWADWNRTPLTSDSRNPPVDGDVVDLDAPLGQQLLHVPIGQAVAQVPADRDRDHLGWEPEPIERRPVDR